MKKDLIQATITWAQKESCL